MPEQYAPGHTVTSVHVVPGVVSALHWIIKNPKEGVKTPEELPHDFVIEKATPYTSPVVSIRSDFDPLNGSVLKSFDYVDTFDGIEDGDAWMPKDHQRWQLPVLMHGNHALKPNPYYVNPEDEVK